MPDAIENLLATPTIKNFLSLRKDIKNNINISHEKKIFYRNLNQI